jgi:hypothetical protein
VCAQQLSCGHVFCSSRLVWYETCLVYTSRCLHTWTCDCCSTAGLTGGPCRPPQIVRSFALMLGLGWAAWATIPFIGSSVPRTWVAHSHLCCTALHVLRTTAALHSTWTGLGADSIIHSYTSCTHPAWLPAVFAYNQSAVHTGPILCGMTTPSITVALLVLAVTVLMPSTALQAARTRSVPSHAHVHVGGLGGPGQELSTQPTWVDVSRGNDLALALA